MTQENDKTFTRVDTMDSAIGVVPQRRTGEK